MKLTTSPTSARSTSTGRRIADTSLLLVGIAALLVIVIRYGMPFRMDDVLYMQWANQHSFLDSFSTSGGEIFLSFRPVMAMTFWLLTHFVGPDHYWIWHTVLVGAFFTAIAFTGLTARYLSEKASALHIASLAYWLAFLPILNILFWFADMTYALEMMFCSAAWYFGIRALDEFRTSFWVTANILGILAVMTKEPSLLLVHGVFVGMIILRRRRIQRGLKPLSTTERIIWAGSYGLFCLVSLVMFSVSRATSTRFFHLGSLPYDQLLFFVKDRIRYYSETLGNPVFTLYFLLGVLGLLVANTAKSARTSIAYATTIVVVAGLLFVVSKPLLLAFLLVMPLVLSLQSGNRGSRRVLVAPFSFIALVNAAFLLITIMLVKTQLAELSFLLSVIAACGTAALVAAVIERVHVSKSILAAVGIVALIGAGFAMGPKLKGKEQLLRDVRSSRTHANEAIKWMARELPQGSTVAVTAPSVIGLRSEDELTSKDDEYKVYAQHTFLQGFVRAYFQALGRDDLRLAYLSDSTILTRSLDSCRSVGGHYLFLETALDIDLAHGRRNGLVWLRGSDSLCHIDSLGGFACEVWALRP